MRRVALAVMALVTAWSVWAWAKQPQHREMATAPTHQESAEDEAPAPINWTQFGVGTPPFLAMLINFGILGAGYYLFGRKPIAEALASRRDTIAKEIEEAARMKGEAEARAKTYQAKLETLEQEVRTAREALVRAGEAERERLVKEAEATAERMRKDAEFMVEQELKQLRLDLWRDAVRAAVAAAGEMLKQRVNAEDQERLAEEYLAELAGAKEPAAAAASAEGST